MDVVTIVARNYLAYAEVLFASVQHHHPEAGWSIVVVDLDEHASVPSDHEVLTLADLGFDVDEVHRRRAMYDVLELATSVKAAALAELLARRGGAATAVYFDPDIVLYRPLVELEGIATTNQIVLTPHVLSPLPMDGRYVGDLTIHSAGVFDLGFVAVSADAGPFLEFSTTATPPCAGSTRPAAYSSTNGGSIRCPRCSRAPSSAIAGGTSHTGTCTNALSPERPTECWSATNRLASSTSAVTTPSTVFSSRATRAFPRCCCPSIRWSPSCAATGGTVCSQGVTDRSPRPGTASS